MLLERMWRSLVTCARNRKPLSQPRAGRTGESDDERSVVAGFRKTAVLSATVPITITRLFVPLTIHTTCRPFVAWTIWNTNVVWFSSYFLCMKIRSHSGLLNVAGCFNVC